uniref:Uncharacterized protein n=1 Tax=Megaselia scalaris TaxID=36166 RepID=T1GDB8_MEGSC
MTTFTTTPGFCPDCGSILPTLRISGNVICYNCKKNFLPEIFGSMATEYTIHFNTYDAGKAKLKAEKDEVADGPGSKENVPSVVTTKCLTRHFNSDPLMKGKLFFSPVSSASIHKESENS